jgi:formate dehydrogenase beta subunit
MAVVTKGTGAAPCKAACPANIDVPRYIRFIAEGKTREALDVIRAKVPFPSVLGRVCPRPCESECRRRELDEAVSICHLKRFVADFHENLWSHHLHPGIPARSSNGKKVAIIGSGPTGLTAAYYLANLGYSATVFESMERPGGMMAFGIPAYRLPRDILDTEIRLLPSSVKMKLGTRIESLGELFDQGFHAVFVALGAQESIRPGIKGEDCPGVMDGLSLLRDINLGREVRLGEKVAVIGGGNVAVDCSRSALRLGAKEVSVIYRRSRIEMPAYRDDIELALREGVDFLFLSGPQSIVPDGAMLKLLLIRMELGDPEADGRRRPIPIKGSEFDVKFDNIIVAVGQRPNIPKAFRLASTPRGTIQVDPENLTTSRKGVFAGGDVVSGPSSVIHAIAMGRTAAGSIDRYLGGEGLIDLVPALSVENPQVPYGNETIYRNRVHPPVLEKKKCLESFSEVIQGYALNQAKEEAQRCLRCDQQILVHVDLNRCGECYFCQMVCSLFYLNACNPEKARIRITPGDIQWKEDCVSGCSFCIRSCSRGALSLGEG